jgi:3-hydroxyisobutyrate dehydrogenase
MKYSVLVAKHCAITIFEKIHIPMIAFLGMGLLGSNFTKALINKGQQVQVWNRTASRAKALEAFGAKAFDTAAEAVKGADFVHIVVKDDTAVDEVLAQAIPGLKPGAIIIDHTTISVQGAVERTARLKEQGFHYQHAPVFMGPPNALDSSGTMLVSGNQELIKQLDAHLSTMTGKVLNLGDTVGKAAGMKLVGNLFLITLTAGAIDMLSLAKAQGFDAADVAALLDVWNPGPSAPARLKKIIGRDYANPSWELNMARKDAGLMMAAAEGAGAELMVIPEVAKVMDTYIDKGHGTDDWTVIGKDK